MTRGELEGVLNLILNESDFQEIEVIQTALQRRAQDLNRVGSVRGNLKGMAQKAAQQTEAQLGFSQERIHAMATDLIRGMLKEKAPELTESQIEELLGAWAPAPGAERPKPVHKAPDLPVDAILTMTEDFLASAEGRMSVRRESELREHFGTNWRKAVWDLLPERVCRLIVVFLEGKIGRDTFWNEVEASSTQ